MIHSKHSDKNITVIIEVDKISDSGYYLSESGDLKMLCDYTAIREVQLYKDAKIKGTFVEKFKAVSKAGVSGIHKSMDKEIEYLEAKLPKIPNNGSNFILGLINTKLS